jgi:hypothetical protein
MTAGSTAGPPSSACCRGRRFPLGPCLKGALPPRRRLGPPQAPLNAAPPLLPIPHSRHRQRQRRRLYSSRGFLHVRGARLPCWRRRASAAPPPPPPRMAPCRPCGRCMRRRNRPQRRCCPPHAPPPPPESLPTCHSPTSLSQYLDKDKGTGWDIAALSDADPDYAGSCGRCYEGVNGAQAARDTAHAAFNFACSWRAAAADVPQRTHALQTPPHSSEWQPIDPVCCRASPPSPPPHPRARPLLNRTAVQCVDSDVRDGYGSNMNRRGSCYDTGKSVKVTITDTCPCYYPSNQYSNKRWCCGDARHMVGGHSRLPPLQGAAVCPPPPTTRSGGVGMAAHAGLRATTHSASFLQLPMPCWPCFPKHSGPPNPSNPQPRTFPTPRSRS